MEILEADGWVALSRTRSAEMRVGAEDLDEDSEEEEFEGVNATTGLLGNPGLGGSADI